MEAIRQAMLGCLVSLPKGAVQAIVVRIRHASDPDSLWYLRSDLLHVLASEKGEMVARDYVNTITPLFEGLLPASLLQSTREER